MTYQYVINLIQNSIQNSKFKMQNAKFAILVACPITRLQVRVLEGQAGSSAWPPRRSGLTAKGRK